MYNDMEIRDRCNRNQVGTFTTREFDFDKDYDDYKSWIEHLRNGVCPAKDILSDKGFIIESNGQKICAGFLYTSNSSMAYIEFVVANHKAHRDLRKESVKILLTQLEDTANNLCYNHIFIVTNNTGFSKTLIEEHGYKAGAKSIEHYKTLWQ